MTFGLKLGEGRCAEVYEWEGGRKVVKLDRGSLDRSAVEKEYRNARFVSERGLEVPQVYEWVELEGRMGFVMERVEGLTLMQRIMQRFGQPPAGSTPGEHAPDEDGFDEVRRMAAALATVHRADGAGLPDGTAKLERLIRGLERLTADEREALSDQLKRLPKQTRVLHGDPNPNNFILREDGGLVLIDWMNATCGSPEMDVAEFVVVIGYGTIPKELPEPMRQAMTMFRQRTLQVFLEEYEARTGITCDQIEPWVPLMAARKLAEDQLPEADKAILEGLIRESLQSSGQLE